MTTKQTLAYGRAVSTSLSQDAAIERAKNALKDEGFGVLCQIDVAATLKEKLGESVPPYAILGACNPTLAHQAISQEPQLGLLLPCNVVVQQLDGVTTVSAIDARALLGVVQNPALLPVADQVNERLTRVLDVVANAA